MEVVGPLDGHFQFLNLYAPSQGQTTLSQNLTNPTGKSDRLPCRSVILLVTKPPHGMGQVVFSVDDQLNSEPRRVKATAFYQRYHICPLLGLGCISRGEILCPLLPRRPVLVLSPSALPAVNWIFQHLACTHTLSCVLPMSKPGSPNTTC